ncbi:hypothetical protein Vadar_021366 [Vaccinium darrowii]|uniref:Uncharacterized protein n=1 Tax=Vaccinium darrowii TaxID=229202 RepID=A0ACB7XSH4_9ERIC|nr:hypothetical protein Vadar_021366 [Vaccinium darrowii]
MKSERISSPRIAATIPTTGHSNWFWGDIKYVRILAVSIAKDLAAETAKKITKAATITELRRIKCYIDTNKYFLGKGILSFDSQGFSSRDGKDDNEGRHNHRGHENKQTSTTADRNSWNPIVLVDISIDNRSASRVVMELFADTVPLMAANFLFHCTGENGVSYHYKGTSFYHVFRDFMCQGSDTSKGNGTGGKSIYELTFADENFVNQHTEPGILSMANPLWRRLGLQVVGLRGM